MTLPVWLVVSVLALLALTAVVAFFRTSRIEALIVASLVICIGIAVALWTQQQVAFRLEAFEDRLTALQARAQASNGSLACVEDIAGSAVDAGCERTIFASPQAVAAATSFTAERFALLADASRYTGRRSARFVALVQALNGSLERDRFGLLANFLTVRENCTVDRCDSLAVLKNPTVVQNNLKTRTFEANLGRYASGWTKDRPNESVASADTSTEEPTPADPAAATKGAPLPKDYVLPSSESIPPISIMTNEPTAVTPPPTPPAQAAAPAPATPRPRPRAQQERSLQPVKRPPPHAAEAPNAPLALTPPSVAE